VAREAIPYRSNRRRSAATQLSTALSSTAHNGSQWRTAGNLVPRPRRTYHRRERGGEGIDTATRNELVLTVTLLALLVAAVLLIANLIGAIHVFG
jgi:hypothetical protein